MVADYFEGDGDEFCGYLGSARLKLAGSVSTDAFTSDHEEKWSSKLTTTFDVHSAREFGARVGVELVGLACALLHQGTSEEAEAIAGLASSLEDALESIRARLGGAKRE